MPRVFLAVALALVFTMIPSFVSAAEPSTQPQQQQREWTFLGAGVAEPSAEQRRQFNLGDAKGAFVNHVLKDSPAARADIRAGDFITRAGDVEITLALQLRDLIRSMQPGDEVTFALIRDGQKVEAKATLEKRALPDRPDVPVPSGRRRPATTTTTAPSARAPWSTATDVRPEDLVPQPYRVHPGDVLELRILGVVGPGITTTKVLRVSGAGTVSLPLVGAVHVAGFTEEEANAAVWKALSVLCW